MALGSACISIVSEFAWRSLTLWRARTRRHHFFGLRSQGRRSSAFSGRSRSHFCGQPQRFSPNAGRKCVSGFRERSALSDFRRPPKASVCPVWLGILEPLQIVPRQDATGKLCRGDCLLDELKTVLTTRGPGWSAYQEGRTVPNALAEECRALADKAEQLATSSFDFEMNDMLRELAAIWRAMADQFDLRWNGDRREARS
jgi:hypothetical protein